MSRLVEVREFDSIACKSECADRKGFVTIDEKDFDSLLGFVKQYNSTEDGSDALEFMSVSFKRGVGDVITVKNYVGIIQLSNGFQLQILPKICFDEDELSPNKKTKEIFINMLRCLKDFPGKKFSEANLNVDRMNLYEIFISMYIKEVEHLLRTGLKSSYVNVEENTTALKGKLLVDKQIVSNYGHKEKFYVSFDEFSVNRAENRIIKSTLKKLGELTTNMQNARSIKQLLASFDSVDYSINYDEDFSKVSLDRNTQGYNNLILWSKVFLTNKSFTTFSGDNNSRALLFPMESVFESYVAKKVKQAFIPNGWKVVCQDRTYYLFNEPKDKFALRPDIVCTKNNQVVIMDTKWKKLINNERKNYGIAQSDMYQMYAYAKKYGTSEIYLIYPKNEEMKHHEEICFISNDNVHVYIHFIDLQNVNDDLNLLLQRINKEFDSEN